MTASETHDNDWRALTEMGAALLRQGRPQEALGPLQQAEQLAPAERDVRYWLANASRMTGQGEKGGQILRALLAERPADLEASFALAFLLRDTGAPGDAAQVLLQASRQPGVTAHQLLQITGFLRDSNQHAAAIEVCEKAARLRPDEADLQFKLARLYLAMGDFEKSLAALHRTLKLQPSTGPAWVALAQQRAFASAADPEFRLIEDAAGRQLGREADMCVAFAYGKALDDIGCYPEAWQQYRKGNTAMSASLNWNRRAWTDFVERARSRPAAQPAPMEPGREAVFIVGMPRSGTTLLEQVLARHARVSGRGELNFLSHFAQQRAVAGALNAAQLKAMGEVLWTQLRQDGPESGAYIDKNPLNFRHLDLLFEILPSARVLHLTRDGRDSCLSCYFQLFEHADTGFSYDLDDLVIFYSGYRRVMAHWERIYPGRILRVDYDQLVRSGGDAPAGVPEFLGLEWNAAQAADAESARAVRTASAWQARQPVHARSVERWRRYYEQAPDFFDRLAAIDAQYQQDQRVDRL